MINVSSREKNMVLLAILVISIALIYKYFAVPYLDSWNTITTQISQMETRLNRAKQIKSGSNIGLYSENTIRNQTATIASLLEEMETWSNEAGVKITSMKPGPVLDKANYRELNFDVEVTGELGPICHLIDSIEQPNEIARINKIRVSKPKDILKDLTTVITVSTICLPDTKQVKKPTQNKESNDL